MQPIISMHIWVHETLWDYKVKLDLYSPQKNITAHHCIQEIQYVFEFSKTRKNVKN